LHSTEKREIQKFGIISVIFFGCLGILGVWMKKPVPACLFGFLSILGLGFFLIPLPLKPIYDIWMKISHIIGIMVTALFLTLAYYLVITPSALIKRIFGGPPLEVKPDKDISSYWVERDEPAQPKDRFIKRY